MHSRYERRRSDSPVTGQETQLHLQVRRFFCRNDERGKKTFAEQVPGLTVRHGHHGTGLREALQKINGRCPEIAVTTELTRQFADDTARTV